MNLIMYAMEMKALYVSSSLSYRVKTLRNCLILRKFRSTTFRFVYNSSSYFQGFLRLLFGGTTGRMPHFFAFARQESPSYATAKIVFTLKYTAFLKGEKTGCTGSYTDYFPYCSLWFRLGVTFIALPNYLQNGAIRSN